MADTFPASLTCTWTCVGAGGGTCTASGSGNINDTVNLPAGGSVTYTASCTIAASATGTLTNTATVTAPAGVDRSDAGQQLGDRQRHPGAAGRSRVTKTDAPDPVDAGRQHHLHHHRHQRRSEQRRLGVALRHPAGRDDLRLFRLAGRLVVHHAGGRSSAAPSPAPTPPWRRQRGLHPRRRRRSLGHRRHGDLQHRDRLLVHADPTPGNNSATATTTVAFSGGDYTTITPCRLLDTRSGSALVSGTAYVLTVQGFCGIPVSARAVALSVTAVHPTGSGFLTLYPADQSAPLASTVNFSANQVLANNAIVLLSADGKIKILPLVGGSGTVHVVIDVPGYFN